MGIIRKDNIVLIPRILLYDCMVLFIHKNTYIIYVVSRCEIAKISAIKSADFDTDCWEFITYFSPKRAITAFNTH